MADLSLLLEAERRGLLPPEKLSLLNEARKRGLVPPLEGEPAAPAAAPAPAPPDPNTWDKIRGVITPTVEALGAAGGAIVGAGAGTLVAPGVGTAAGGVGGAGLGYGMAKEALRIGDTFFGSQKPPERPVLEPVQNVLEGATMEAGGRVAMPLIAKGLGKVADVGQFALQKAAGIARRSLGPDLETAVNMLRGAPQGVTAGQATAEITSPTWQALNRQALNRDPRFAQTIAETQKRASENALAQIAGGNTSTAARATREVAKDNLNAITTPMRDSALKRGNLGQSVADMEARAAELGAGASAEVQKVRELMSAGKTAEAWARLDLINRGLPVGAQRFTHFGELAEKAFGEWSDAAAKGSLDLGQGARFAQAAANSLRSMGIKPLETKPLIEKVLAINRNPEFASNKLVNASVDDVAKSLAEWTNSGGIIDLRALDAIRRNSVNATIQRLLPSADVTTQQAAAAKVMTELKPLITSAIEDAGGTGYREYLAEHTKGMQRIAEKKLAGKAAELFKTNKDAFVALVEGNNPKEVEKILGPGNYDIAKEVSQNTMDVLREQARVAIRDARVASQATRGESALKELMAQNISILRFPSYLSVWASSANKTLEQIEERVGRRTLQHLTEAMKDPKAAANLLSVLPATERLRILKVLNDPSLYSQAKTAAVVGVRNALAPENNNALAE